ncbi:MAG: prolipoprotein diacylglyceryl transferase [Mangrovibacterium sp.]
MFLNYIIWDVSPVAFHIGNTELRWYGLMFPIGFLLGYLLARRMFKIEDVSLNLLDTLFIIVFLSGIIGARIGHVIFYDWEFFKEHPSEIIKTWHGGLASHGGVFGVLFALLIWSRFSDKSFSWVIDKVAVCASLLAGLIRIGNLMNSEIYGIATDMPWGFIFVQQGETDAKHPTQLYEAIYYFGVFILLYYLYFNKKAYRKVGLISGLFGVLIFMFRFFIEFIKNDQSEFEAGMFLNMGQILSIPLICFSVFLVVNSRKTQET